MFSPGRGGTFSTKWERERPSLSGIVRSASASIGWCLHIGGEGTRVRLFSRR